MQLRVARVCLDCEEVHDAQTCPVCASEAFAFLTRWVPAPERRVQPRPTTSPEAEVVRTLTTSSSRTWVTRGALGLTVLGLAGWALAPRKSAPKVTQKSARPADEAPDDEKGQRPAANAQPPR